MVKVSSFYNILLLLLLLLVNSSKFSSFTTHHPHNNRRLLHHPFFTTDSPPPSHPPTASPPANSPSHHHHQQQQQPKLYPFSSSPGTTTTTSSTPATTTANPFFPSYLPPPPPPPPPGLTALPTFPANISSLAIPRSSASSSHSPVSAKLITVFVLLSLVVVSLLVSLALIHRYRIRRHGRGNLEDNVRLYPPDAVTSDSDGNPPPKPRGGRAAVSNTSSEFLYLGTLANSHEFEQKQGAEYDESKTEASSALHKMESPELRPLPPLPKQNFRQNSWNSDGGLREKEDDEEEEEFFSPRGSSERMDQSSSSRRVLEGVEFENLGGRSSNSSYPESNSESPIHNSIPSSSSPSPILNFRSRSLRSDPPVNTLHSPPVMAPPSAISIISSPGANSSDGFDSPSSVETPKRKLPPVRPPPPPPPLPRHWEGSSIGAAGIQQPLTGPPPLIPPSRPAVFSNNQTESGEMEDEARKPKLKPLHWDKVRASSDRAMVWDQLKASSFQLNEEMIETLFMATGSHNVVGKENTRRSIMPSLNEENRVLDPKKSQNIAILLRALNVTVEEVCDALLEGNVDTLGSELLESLLKMAPTEEEEQKLKDYRDESPFKLGPAEKFLQAVIHIPFAFKRVDAMVYIVNFDSEVEYLSKSFEALEAACEELRTSRMFLKLLEAVLKTGNRMNVGTDRGDAQAFKLDTLLKLVDIKGTDGKTTLLHFVVQEIIKAEGSRLSETNHTPAAENSEKSDLHDDIESRKHGLEVVAGLGGDLTNVKKAAAMDSDTLSGDVRKLASEIAKVQEIIKLIVETGATESNKRFSDSMRGFLKKAEEEISSIQAQESNAFTKVKELTEYFHGNSAKEEAHPLRIFMVVRDFLAILDRVCKEVGKMNERTIISSARQFPMPTPFPELKREAEA